MKKSIIIIVCVAVLAITACFIYFNSDSYKYKLAREYRAERLNKLNNIRRLYIYEGVYSFDSNEKISTSFTDKFGETVTNTKTVYYGKGEVSLKSDKIVIILKNHKEEIILADPYLSSIFSERYVYYKFPIVHWEAYKNDILFFQFDSTENKKYREAVNNAPFFNVPTLTLKIDEITEGGKSRIEASLSLSIIGVHYSLTSFYSIPRSLYNAHMGIKLNNLIYKYESLRGVPEYVNAKYEPKLYDIEECLLCVKRSYYKNPFILNKKWE